MADAAALLLLFLGTALFLGGAFWYDRRIESFQRHGRRLTGRILSYEKRRERRDAPRAPWVTRLYFEVEYPSDTGPVRAKVMTEDRTAHRYVKKGELPLALEDGRVMFLGDVPEKGGKYALLLMGIICLAGFVAELAGVLTANF